VKLTANAALVAALVAGLSMSAQTSATTDAEQMIIDRIKASGQVCLEGDDSCGSAAAVAAVSSGAARSGEEVYTSKCLACHATGAAGAPKFGSSDWADRRSKGIEALLETAINGIGAMPPKGLCNDCSDDELKLAIEHMLDSAP